MSVVSPVAATAAAKAEAESDSAKGDGVLDGTRQRIAAYYEQRLDVELTRLRRLRLLTRWRKIALALLGAAILVGCAAAWIASSYGYITLHRLEVYEIALGVIAIVLIAVSLLMKGADDVPEPEEVEREVNSARDQDFHTLLGNARKLLATVQQPVAEFEVRLVGYPDRELCDKLGAIKCARLALDQKRLRLTPAKITAVELLPQRFAIYEGTVDLTTGLMLAERLVEAHYRDILAIERSSLAQPASRPREGAIARMMRPGRPRPLRDQDMLTIQIANNQAVRIVLRDSTFTDSLKGTRLPLSDSHEAIEKFWQQIRKRWLEERATP